jgi:GNAT superfamily N-acetyltransferase
MKGHLEIVVLRVQHVSALAKLFDEIAKDRASVHFHPHRFDSEMAEWVCAYAGKDLYFGLIHEGVMVGYGMLRGWDKGYETPSLGIYISADLRGTGAASLLMQHMHQAAKLRGSTQVLLKVHPENRAARRLYERFGYEFSECEGEQLVGRLTASCSKRMTA